jgi:hypothetical protein
VASPTFTIPNGEVVDAVALWLKLYGDGTTGTLTIAIFDGAVELQTGTLTIADLSPADKALDEVLVLIPLSSSVTGDGGTDYTLKLKADATNKIQARRQANVAGDWWRVPRSTTASSAAPTTGDNLVVVGVGLSTTSYIVTMNETATTAYGWVRVGAGGTLRYGGPNAGDYTAAATNYVLRCAGHFWCYVRGTVEIGSVGHEVPRDSTAVLEMACASMGQYGIYVYGTFTAQGLSRTSGKNVTWALLTADMSTSATSCTVDRDTGWLQNDEVGFAGTKTTGAGEGESKTLNTGATSDTLAWTGGTTYTHKATTVPTPGEVLLLTRNVKIRSTSSSYYTWMYSNGASTVVDFDWVETQYCGATTANIYCFHVTANSSGTYSFDYCGFRSSVYGLLHLVNPFAGTYTSTFCTYWATGSTGTCYNLNAATVNTVTITDCCISAANAGNFNPAFDQGYAGCIVERNRVSCGEQGFTQDTTNDTGYSTFVDNVAHSLNYDGFATSGIRVTGCTIDGFTCWGTNRCGIYFSGGAYVYDFAIVDTVLKGNTSGGVIFTGNADNVRISNLTTDGLSTRSSACGVRFDPGYVFLDIVLDNCSFGAVTKHTNGDVATTGTTSATGFWSRDVRFRDCTFGSDTLAYYMPSGMQRGSWISFEKHGTAPIHRRLTDTGWITIETTTYRTNSPSEKIAPSGATSTRKMRSAIRQVVVNASASKTISVWVRKDSSYAGNAPRLIQRSSPALGSSFDADVVVDTHTAAADTWEELTGTASTPDADGVMEFYVDCDGSAGAIFVDDWAFS